MGINALNHINYVGNQQQLLAIKDFYCDILGLSEGWRPDFSLPGYWLYAGDCPLIHLIETPEAAENFSAQRALDHIAFSCSDLDPFIEQLKAKGIAYHRGDYPSFNTVQLVVHDPLGLKIELNFSV